MAEIKKNTLSNFLDKLKKHKGKFKKGEILEEIANVGVQTVQDEYQQTNYIPQSIGFEMNENSVKISAIGKGISYVEYGTGLIGKGTYQGNLPTQPITFESPKGDVHTTQGWEYYYKNLKTKDYIMGGWFYGKNFTRGEPAQAQMFKASMNLQNNLSKILKNKLKGER